MDNPYLRALLERLNPPPELFSGPGSEPQVYGISLFGVEIGLIAIDRSNLGEAMRRKFYKGQTKPETETDINRHSTRVLSACQRLGESGALGLSVLSEAWAYGQSADENRQLLQKPGAMGWLSSVTMLDLAEQILASDPNQFLKLVRTWRQKQKRGPKPKILDAADRNKVLRARDAVVPILDAFVGTYGTKPGTSKGAGQAREDLDVGTESSPAEFDEQLQSELIRPVLPGSTKAQIASDLEALRRRPKQRDMLVYLVARKVPGLSERQVRRILTGKQ
jgi:hypothetical protein